MADALRLDVVAANEDSGGGFEVLAWVNGVELTHAGAGMGMDPWDVLIPVNCFLPTDPPRPTPFARCICGDYGCGETDVVIARDGDQIHWDFSKEKPLRQRVSFDADHYLSEVLRIEADRSWEPPERTAGRLIYAGLRGDQLDSLGLAISWLENSWRAPDFFHVCLTDNEHQIFVQVPWNGQTPGELATAMVATLDDAPPSDWHASWLAMRGPEVGPPAIAAPGWRKHQF